MTVELKNDWNEILQREFAKDYYLRLREFLKNEYSTETIYPNMFDIFGCLQSTPYEKVKAVIIGQDPYHGPGQAHGLSFSVQKGVKQPPSLQNVFKELHDDLGLAIPTHGNLDKWANEGVLLLNTVLTVRRGSPASHRGKGWERLTDTVIQRLNERQQPIVFILWGKHAQEKENLIDTSRHFIIKSAHPSPFSAHRGFLGSRPFSRTNHYLKSIGDTPIDWQLPVE